MWQMRIRRSISAVESPPEELGVPAPHLAPHPKAGKRSPHNIWQRKLMGNSSIQVRWKAAGKPGILLSPHMDSFSPRHSPWALMDRQHLRKHQRQTETELCGCRARVGGTTGIIPVLNPLPIQLVAGPHLSCIEPSPQHG